MSKVRVGAFSVSIDGFGAGPRQDLDNPLGVRGLELHNWFFETAAFKQMHGQTGGSQGMQTLDQCLTELVAKGLVGKEEARYKASNKDAM